ncbi:MAG TPA: hypothetical protein VNR38_08540 [Ureibacillus sp.]|nr:hypothetical protein [Ureibacillus sp.]
MGNFADLVVLFIFMMPIYGLLIWTYMEPEESLLTGRRWMYKGDPEPSPKAIRYTKFTSMTAMIGIPFIIIGLFSKNIVLSFLPLIIILVYVLGALRIFISDEES